MASYPINIDYVLAADATTVTLLEVIPVENMAGGSVESTAARTITIYGCNQADPKGKTFVAAYDQDGVAIATMTFGAAGIMELPTIVYSYRYICLVSSTAGTVYVHLKPWP